MKERRYFCDYWYDRTITKILKMIIIPLILIGIVGDIIGYYVIKCDYEYEFKAYSEEQYVYLADVANNVIEERNLSAIPEDVAKYEITKENNEIILKFYLDNNKDAEFAKSANMTVRLSKDFNIISMEPNFSLEEEYVNSIKMRIITYVGTMIFFLVIIIGFLLFIISMICVVISKKHKEKKVNLS